LSEGLIIKRSVFQNCLEIYSMTEWMSIMGKVNSLNPFVKKNNDFKRLFTAGVKTVELDSAGRFLIPKDLVAFSGLSKELVLSCSANIIEVWDKNKYEEVVGDTSSDFADLAEQVMGDLYGE
jgi:MraZ protein